MCNERALTVTVNNIEHIESTSYNGIAVIKVFLQPGASVEAAVAQITAMSANRLAANAAGHDSAVDHPIQRLDRADFAVQFQQPEVVGTALFDMTANLVRVGLASTRGAMIPWPYGGKQRVVAVDLNLPALKSKNLLPQDVVNAITAQNLVLPSGTTKIGANGI